MSSRLRQPTEQELRDLAMTLAGELDPSKSRYDDPQTRIEAANILATIVNRFSTNRPQRFGRSPVSQYNDYSDVVRNPVAYNAWSSRDIGRTRQNYDQRPDYFNSIVEDFFSGELEPTFPNATHYHADHIEWRYASSLDRLGNTGPHIFYNDERHAGRGLGQHRPSYEMAEFESTPARQGPNPATDFNRQELAHIAPPIPVTAESLRQAQMPELPATGEQMATARREAISPLADPDTPMANRTFGGYRESIFSPTHANSGFENISPRTRDMLDRISQTSGLSDLGINSGFRTREHNQAVGGKSDSPHLGGHAVDIDVSRLNADERTRLLDSAIDAGARGVGVANSFLHIDTDPNKEGVRGTGFRTWGYDATGGEPAPWAFQSERYQDMFDGATPVELGYLGVTSPVSREEAMRQPRGEETAPRLSETYPSPTSAPRSAPSSTFNAVRPSYPSGLPAARARPEETAPRLSETYAPRSPLDTMRAQSDQIIQDTARAPSGPFSISGPPASAPRKSPDQFQYAPYRAPTPPAPTPPQSPSMSTMAQQYGLRALETVDPFEAPAPTVPGPVQGPQFGNVPNPMARPPSLPQPLGPQVPRRRGPVPNPVVPPNVPRKQSTLDQAISGLGNWAQDFMAPRFTDPISSNVRRAPRIQQAGPPMQLAPSQAQPAQANFLQGLLSTQPTNPSLNGRAQGPWNSTGGEGGFVW